MINEGDVVLAALPQADGQLKLRPALVLRRMPPFGDFLVCGISSQLQHAVPGFDETIELTHTDFSASGLKGTSLIRLGFLIVKPEREFSGRIGRVSVERWRRLLAALSHFLCDHD